MVQAWKEERLLLKLLKIKTPAAVDPVVVAETVAVVEDIIVTVIVIKHRLNTNYA